MWQRSHEPFVRVSRCRRRGCEFGEIPIKCWWRIRWISRCEQIRTQSFENDSAADRTNERLMSRDGSFSPICGGICEEMSALSPEKPLADPIPASAVPVLFFETIRNRDRQWQVTHNVDASDVPS